MTLPSRIELAARDRWARTHLPEHRWEDVSPEGKANYRSEIEQILKAAFPDAPGLFSDPPQVWIAPWDMTDAMSRAGEMEALWDDVWDAFRDAHLSTQSDKPEKGEAK